ncbi:hypothetical protein A3K78_08715 [Candidatus Bathyarchaeota archaeon RBG_13_52_12]|nr:MAG: hypothetical protein A3K78_08715 [Candidatus Bathyarchaeota archaeon RBG_13_52_12]
MYKNRKAVSPVIATVILVAVAITISVAVAYWMGGISSQYTKFEKVEVSSAICESTVLGAGGWKISLSLKNTGTAQVTLKNVFINDAEVSYDDAAAAPADAAATVAYSLTTGLGLASGETKTTVIWIADNYKSFTAGTTINIKLHSAGGMDYLKLIELV